MTQNPKLYRSGILGLSFALALLAQLWLFASFGVRLDLTLAALVVLALFADFSEVIFFSLLSIWVFNWQPGWNLEMILILILPLLSFALRRVFPGQPWLLGLFVLLFGSLFFYILSGFAIFFGNILEAILAILPLFLFGSVLFYIFRRTVVF